MTMIDDVAVRDAGTKGGVRHGFIELGPVCVLHPFEFRDSEQTNPGEMFQRGRLDHIAINAVSMEAFEIIMDRLVADGASDGTITDFGAVLSVFFRDPDGRRPRSA